MARCGRSRCRASSQAIVCVQLVAWCAAACLLLYRGVTTLRREPPPRLPPRPPPAANFSLQRGVMNGTGDGELLAELPVSTYNPFTSNNEQASNNVSVTDTRSESKGHQPSAFARLRRELRPASLILMVLGFSMLLVGPVVVVLRKCDSTLNQRRASKAASEEDAALDAPPSYDEATLSATPGTQAPRYSSLFCHTDAGELVLLNPPAAKVEIAPSFRRA